jgi:predicted phage terminase large subunit-like protein
MMNSPLSPQQAAQELLRRRRARVSLVDYALAIDVPGRPVSNDLDEWVFHPVETGTADHHALLMRTLEEVEAGSVKQLMVFMPPGSAKSTYVSVVFTTWFMGKKPGRQVILASYASDIARKQGRRARQIVKSAKFRPLFDTAVRSDNSAADEWSLDNGSEFMAGGIHSGVTGNRADGLIIDDPVAGREDADSETIRRKTKAAYEDDLLTRLKPGGWTIIVQTRWNQGDLSGSILPENWNGESGDIKCRDGLVWRVLCLPAIADRLDDPLGRAIGEPLWPEWFKNNHFDRFKLVPRTWSALYQQKPAPETGDYFQGDWIRPVAKLPPKTSLNIYGASDYAVTKSGGDYTVHVVIGIDPDDKMYLLDLWRGQTSSDVWIETFCDLVLKWSPIGWAEETGQIRAGVGPHLERRQRERHAYVTREAFPTRGDKAVRAQSIRGRMSLDGLYVAADAPFRAELLRELLSFPSGVHDDQVDALGLVGQLLDQMYTPSKPEGKKAPVERDWFDESDDDDAPDWRTA